MDLSGATAWWVVAGVLVAAELTSGTFYLLLLALGMAAGAVAAHAGLPVAAQLVLAALVGGGTVAAAWNVKRRRGAAPEPAASNRDVNLDIGSRVHVRHWNADGTARVPYRGAEWNVRYQGSGAPTAGDYTIRAFDGSCLLVDR